MTPLHADEGNVVSSTVRGGASTPGVLPNGADLPNDLEFVAELGQGAHATVYRVRRHGAEYALKILRRRADARQSLRELRREAAVHARINHPGVPRVFDVGYVGDAPYLVMELLEGTPLVDLLDRGPLSQDAVVRLGMDVASALAAVHGAGLVHRDVKPANIILSADGTARLIDFGLAAREQADRETDVAAGTFDYASPEQTGTLRRAVDGRADLYSLGVVLFECVTGVRPFVSDDVGELLRWHATAQVPDVRERRADFPAHYAALITKLLAKDPDDRYQSADEVWQHLAATTGHHDGVAVGPHGHGPTSLIGRDRERATLLECWREAHTGAGGTVLVVGATGTGKATLAGFVAAAARAAGGVVLAGKCDPDHPVPLGPLRAALDRYVRSVAALAEPDRGAAVHRIRAAAGAGSSLLTPLSGELAGLLELSTPPAEDRSEHMVSAVADFLIELARRAEGMVLQVDDVQWADPSTRRVLQRLAADLPDAPLLLTATARDGDRYADAVADFIADMGPTLRARIGLGHLDDSEVAELVASQLPGTDTNPELVALLVARGGGNPFATLEYLHALTDAGALSPQWGTWRLDTDVLQSLPLPDDVLQLVLARIDTLGTTARQILVTAAAIGARFRPGVVSAASGLEPGTVSAAIREATDHRLVEASGALTADVEVRFIHDRIREALLHGEGDAALRRLHQRIAEAMDTPTTQDPQAVYAVALHYAAGEPERNPGRVYHTGWAAGRLALAENAVAAAVSFLEPAAAAAQMAGMEPDSAFQETLGQAYLRTGRLDAAELALQRALDGEVDSLRRGSLLLSLAMAQRGAWNIPASVDSCRQGLAEIGHRMPRNPLLLVVTTCWTLLLTVVTGKLGFGRLGAHTSPEKREQVRLQAALNLTAAHSCGVGLMRPILPFFSARAGWAAARLGPSGEYVQALIGLGMMLRGTRQRRRAQRVFERARSMALDTLGDPKLAAESVVMEGLAELVSGADHGETLYRRTEEQRRWLDTGLYLNGTTVHCLYLIDRGYAREALKVYEHGMSVVAADELPAGLVHRSVEVMARAQLGEATDAVTLLQDLRRNGNEDPGRLLTLVTAAVQCAYEEGDLDDRFEEAIATFAALGVPTRCLYMNSRTCFAYVAYGRLAQCRQAATGAPAELPARLAAAHAAVKDLGKAANFDLLRAHHAVARASLLQLSGHARKALVALSAAEPSIFELDCPTIAFEVARIRARALNDIGAEAEAQRQAMTALALAERYGWRYRVRWVQAEFKVTAPRSSAARHTERGVITTPDQFGRRLAALQQVSLAASSVLDPQELARVALDQTLAIFRAERALFFLAQPDATLQPVLGRGNDGNDVASLTGYSSTMIDRAATGRKALVVAGTDEAAALGSDSAVVHGLRSIMVAPLEIDGRLLGVVYLDSRVAKGIFTADDVDLLLAITHQVAAALETTRAAQLDTAVRVAREQRDLAETLRQSMSELSGTLEPDEVIRRLLRQVSHAASAERACLLLRDGETWTMSTPEQSEALHGDALDAVIAMLEPSDFTGSGGVDPSSAGTEQFGDLLGDVTSSLTVPIRTRHGSGLLVAGSATRDAFTEAEREIAAALAQQGAAAYDNARLYERVEQLATTDPLTGIANRRHFTDLAERQLAMARRTRRPLSAMMVDIDHFKGINDTYGHAVGDEVIKTVARTIGANIRAETDILGRHGGEEFAVVLPEIGDAAVATAERVRAAIEAQTYAGTDGPRRVTVSVGVADMEPEDTMETLLHRADEALYRAKERGRNQVQTQ